MRELDGTSPPWLRVALFVHILLYALVAGVFWGTWFSLSRSIAEISPTTFLEVGRTMIRNLGGTMPILVPAAILSGLPAVYGLFRWGSRPALVASAAGLLLLIGALVVTLAVNVPIDNQIKAWTAAALPPDWEATRDRWQVWHTARTFASLAGLACAVVSGLLFGRGRTAQRVMPEAIRPQ